MDDEAQYLPEDVCPDGVRRGLPIWDELHEEHIELGAAGKCMTCETVLPRDSIVVVNNENVLGAFCSGVCFTDGQVVGWLREQFDDLKERIEFRKEGTP